MKLRNLKETVLKYEYGITVTEADIIEVLNPHDNTKMFLYFNVDDIKNYNKANEVVHHKFSALLNEGIEMARQQGQAGIKKLSKCAAQVEFTINGNSIKKSIDYEIKINKSASRIGVVAFQSRDLHSPTLLVAALFMEDGLHQGKAKKYCKHAYLLDKHGLFQRAQSKAELPQQQKRAVLSL